jgi:Spy/CpxP family protein refolding chaperone
MRASWIIAVGAGSIAGFAAGCAGSLEQPAVASAETASEEHLAVLEAIPAAAVRLIEGPALALDHWEYLDLSVDQLRRLEDLDLRVERERAALLLGMEDARNALAAATDGPFDESRVRGALDMVAAARTESSLLTFRAREETIALLTPEQASLLSGFAREHVHMMMMGWVTEICSGTPGAAALDALVSDATGAMIPCLPMPMTNDGGFEPGMPHIH